MRTKKKKILNYDKEEEKTKNEEKEDEKKGE